jgi:SM-20-related protein
MDILQPSEIVDVERLRAAALAREPFPFLIVPNFLRSEALARVEGDFPAITRSGSFPLDSLTFGPAFASLIDALTGIEMKSLIEEKFALDLSGHPVMTTVRGVCTARDGHIHTDSKSKLITMLLYMNRGRECASARLRLLHSPDDLEDYAAEVPPREGTLVVFQNGPKAWHGFAPFHGQRRVIQVNWVKGDSVVSREQTRHRISAFFKRLLAPAKTHAAQY